MIIIFLLSVHRFYRGFLFYIISFSLIWSPVMQARAVPLVALIPISVAAARVFSLAASRMGPLLTHTNIGIGVGIGSAAHLIDKNWSDIIQYMASTATAQDSSKSNGVLDYVTLTSASRTYNVSTDTVKVNLSGYGEVSASYGAVPLKDSFPGAVAGSGVFPSPRRDGHTLFSVMSGHTFSSIPSSGGFTNHLCRGYAYELSGFNILCDIMPTFPMDEFSYYSNDSQLGVGCNDPSDCVQAHVAALLAIRSNHLIRDKDAHGNYKYEHAITDVVVSYQNCFDSRTSGYSNFSGYRCSFSLSYTRSPSSPYDLTPPTFESINNTINVRLFVPAITSASSLPRLINGFPPLGSAPVTPESIANIVNSMFLRATAVEGYEGVKYFPITTADAVSALGADSVPLSSFSLPVSTVSSGSGSGVVTPPAPGGAVTPPGALDLGSDPGIAAPILQATPTALQIMAPIFDLFPSLQNFQVPGHTSQCPSLVVPFFGKDIFTNKHCELLDNQRSAIGASALVAWSIAAIIIVLGA